METMSDVKILHEYQPGEYCKDTKCLQYNNGKFTIKCNDCGAFAFYLWLKNNGYKLLIVRDE